MSFREASTSVNTPDNTEEQKVDTEVGRPGTALPSARRP